jgi:hypothetical protein
MLEQVTNALELSADQQLRAGLLAQRAYNAVVVADHHYQGVRLFGGYDRVCSEIAKRIVTYIGSSSWRQVAEQTRRQVVQILTNAGVW